MITKIIEVTNNQLNWGKFMLGWFDEAEWSREIKVAGGPSGIRLFRSIGIDRSAHPIWVLDLQTGEGAMFYPGGNAKVDLDRHKIWVCPMFEPFLEWLYKQDLADIPALPDAIDLKHAEFSFQGYRRSGKK